MLTVKEAIFSAAGMLGIENKVRGFVEKGQTEGEKETQALLRCFNVVENEIALDYLPLCIEDEVESETGIVEYGKLTKSAVRVIKVRDESGNSAPFKIFPKYVKTLPGKVGIVYAYAPVEKAIGDKSDFTLQVSPRLFGYGMAAEYCLAAGLFEEAAVWENKYKDALTAAYRSRPSRVIRSRRWA